MILQQLFYYNLTSFEIYSLFHMYHGSMVGFQSRYLLFYFFVKVNNNIVKYSLVFKGHYFIKPFQYV